MKVKVLSHYPKTTFEVNNVFFSSDLHLHHEAIIKFGRKFSDIKEMDEFIINQINLKVGVGDMLVLLGDSMMVDKNYNWLLGNLDCKMVILLPGNHCNIGKLYTEFINNDNLIYSNYYLELVVDGQIICCSHYPMFNWNYQDEGSFSLHGHLHGDENNIIRDVHKYRSLDVGIDNYYNLFNTYSVFSFEQIKDILSDKKLIGRHEKT